MSSSSRNTWFQLLLKQIGKNSLSVIFIFIIYFMLWYVPQINDLILAINQSDNHIYVVPIFFVILTVFAFVISTVNLYIHPVNLEKIKSGLTEEQKAAYEKKQQGVFKPLEDEKEMFTSFKNDDGNNVSGDYEETSEEYLKRMFPKVLGTILILVTAYAVNNTFFEVSGDHISLLGNAGLTVLIVILVLFTNKKIVDFVLRYVGAIINYRWFAIVLISLSFLVIIYAGYRNQQGSTLDIKYFFYILLILGLQFYIFTTSNNDVIVKIRRKIYPIIIVLTFAVFLMYAFLFFDPSGLKVLTPLSIVLICILGVYIFMNVIRFFSARYKRFPSLPLVLIILAYFALNNTSSKDFNHYEASHVPTKIKVSERLELEDYTAQWVADRKEDILKSSTNEPFPIILVSSEGGGSRAGLWTFLVQSYLFDQNPDYFRKYLFSLSGASGGGVGNNMFYTQAYKLLEGSNAAPLKYAQVSEDGFHYRASKVYNGDYLSSSVAGLLGRDSFVSITGWFSGSFPDRGAILENEWEEQYAAAFNREKSTSLGGEYLQMMPKKGQYNYIRPLLITSVTHSQSGQRFIVSPVAVNNSKHNMNVFPDLLELYPNKDNMIKRSTAMSMNARFPYVSPVARIEGVGQFADAGYYNNIGGSVSLRLQRALLKELAKDTTLTGKYEIRQLSVTNYVKPSEEVIYASQLTAPASSIAQATFAHPTESNKTFDNIYSIQSKATFIVNSDGDSIKPFIPLGRFLSKNTVKSLEQRLFNIESKVINVIKR